MSEMCEMFSAIHELNRQHKAENMLKSTAILQREGIPFVSKNDGVHLIVADRWDFWPSTGLFIDRKDKSRKRGVFNLLKIVKSSL